MTQSCHIPLFSVSHTQTHTVMFNYPLVRLQHQWMINHTWAVCVCATKRRCKTRWDLAKKRELLCLPAPHMTLNPLDRKMRQHAGLHGRMQACMGACEPPSLKLTWPLGEVLWARLRYRFCSFWNDVVMCNTFRQDCADGRHVGVLTWDHPSFVWIMFRRHPFVNKHDASYPHLWTLVLMCEITHYRWLCVFCLELV